MTSSDRYLRLKSILPMDLVNRAFAIVGGAGALGNEALKNLALIGFGNILVCDFDDIELHNLTRSILFRREDEGRSKAEVAAERIREINPDVNVIPFCHNIAELGLGFYRRADAILATFDAIFPRLVINEACMRTARPWVDAALSASNVAKGVVTVFDPSHDQTACYTCDLDPDTVNDSLNRVRGIMGCQAMDLLVSEAGGVPSSPMSSSVIAGSQITAAISVMQTRNENGEPSPWIGKSFEIDLRNLSSRLIKKKRFPGCHSHDDLSIVPIENIEIRKDWNSEVTTPKIILEAGAERLGTEMVSLQMHERIIGQGKCTECGQIWPLFIPISTLRIVEDELSCPACGKGQFSVVGELGSYSEIDFDFPLIDKPLKGLGFRRLDVLSVLSFDEEGIALERVWFEVAGDAALFGLGPKSGGVTQ